MEPATIFPSIGAIPRRGLLRAGFAMGGSVLASPFAMAADLPREPAGLTVAPNSQAGASPRLTVHAIDTYHGATGAGLRIDLLRFEGERWQLLKTVRANAGGRPAEPMLMDDNYRTGRYEVMLHLDEYFAQMGAKLPSPTFLSKVPLRFVIQDAAQRVHLAALFSPWGYSYYRGS